MLFKSCEIGQKVVYWDYKGTCLAITFCYGKYRGLLKIIAKNKGTFFLERDKDLYDHLLRVMC